MYFVPRNQPGTSLPADPPPPLHMTFRSPRTLPEELIPDPSLVAVPSPVPVPSLLPPGTPGPWRPRSSRPPFSIHLLSPLRLGLRKVCTCFHPGAAPPAHFRLPIGLPLLCARTECMMRDSGPIMSVLLCFLCFSPSYRAFVKLEGVFRFVT